MQIDNKNISDFTALLLNDYNGIAKYPPMKSVQSNDWAEENGLEIDLIAPKLDKKTFDLSFLLTDKTKYNDFVDFLTQKTYRNWNFTEISKNFNLRVTGFSSYKEFLTANELKINLSDDFPLQNYTYTPVFLNSGEPNWLLDDTPFSRYGVHVLLGSNEIHQVRDMKNVLEISNCQMQGVKVASRQLKLKSRKATIRCFVVSLISDFWKQYYCFLYDWAKQGIRTLQADGKTYQCYYESSNVQDFLKEKKIIRCAFDINLIII